MYSQHAAELIFHTCITVVSVILLKGPFHLWNICFWLPEEGLSKGCPVRGIGNKCLLVIGNPTHLSSNIHAGDLGEFRGCRDIGYSPIILAVEQAVNVSAESREPPPEELHYKMPAGNMGFSTEVSRWTSQFLRVAQCPAFRWKECVISWTVKVAFEV